MQINIKSVRFKADKQLEDFITERLQKIGKHHENIIGSDVILKLENTETPENKVADIRLKIKGNDLHSSKQCKTFEEATDLAVDALRKQLKKVKEKPKSKKISPKIVNNVENTEEIEIIETIEDLLDSEI